MENTSVFAYVINRPADIKIVNGRTKIVTRLVNNKFYHNGSSKDARDDIYILIYLEYVSNAYHLSRNNRNKFKKINILISAIYNDL